MCDALLLSRAKVEKTLDKWAERLPTGGSLSSFVHKEVLALSKSPGTMRLDMTFREKFTTLADAVAEGIAISGVPLDAASSSLVGAIVKLWDPDCPIPSPDAIATRIGPLFKDAASKLSELVRRILSGAASRLIKCVCAWEKRTVRTRTAYFGWPRSLRTTCSQRLRLRPPSPSA